LGNIQEVINVQKVVITVLGKDKVGIMAKVCTYLADNGINILDISQTIVSGFFNMMMIADMGEKQDAFEQVRTELDELGQSIGVQVRIQREDIFDMMHRL
jgi:ACT domain-containing protein